MPQVSTASPNSSGANRLHGLYLPCVFLLVAMFNLTLIVVGLRELIVEELGGSERQASLFFSIEMFAYILFAPLWGILSDRWGRRKPMVSLGFLLSALIYWAYCFVDSIPLLLSLRFVQGAFTVMGWSTLMAWVLDHSGDGKLGRTMGLMGGALSLGVSLGAPLGGYITRDLGPRAPLGAAALLFFLLAIGSLALRGRPRLRRHISVGEIVGTLTSRPRLLLPYGFYFADRFTVGFFVVLFPLYLGSLGVEDPAVRGRYLALYLLPFALLQYFAGRLAEKTGPYLPLLLGSFLYGVALCAVGYSSLYALWPVMAALGVLAAVMFPPAIVLTAQLSDSHTRGSAMGGFNLAGSLGFAVGPLVGVWAFEQRGYGFAFMLSGALEILAVVVALALLAWWRRKEGADLG